MAQQTARDLPVDHYVRPSQHVAIATQMRETENWVHAGTYRTRRSAYNAASRIRNSGASAYRGHIYDARAITTETGEHQVWGRWIGAREVRR